MIQTQAKLAFPPSACPSVPAHRWQLSVAWIAQVPARFHRLFSSESALVNPRPLYYHQLPPISLLSFFHLPRSSFITLLSTSNLFFFKTRRLWQEYWFGHLILEWISASVFFLSCLSMSSTRFGSVTYSSCALGCWYGSLSLIHTQSKPTNSHSVFPSVQYVWNVTWLPIPCIN